MDHELDHDHQTTGDDGDGVGHRAVVHARVAASSTWRSTAPLAKVFQQSWDNQSFTAGVNRTFTANWAIPANQAVGTYTIKAGMFGPGWNPLQHWNGSAGIGRGDLSGHHDDHDDHDDHDVTADDAATDDHEPPTNDEHDRTTTTTQPPTTTTTQPRRPRPRSRRRPRRRRPPTTTTTPPGTRFATLPPGATLPSGAVCATRVRSMSENRPDNVSFNSRRGTAANGRYPRVTGDFTGTTDEIIQWAACKWGLDEDWARAQTSVESGWNQRIMGDFTTSSSACIPAFPIGNYPPQWNGDATHNGQCPESIGLIQDRYLYHTEAFQGNNAVVSTAYNVDYGYAVWRSCFEGEMGWLNTLEHSGTYCRR